MYRPLSPLPDVTFVCLERNTQHAWLRDITAATSRIWKSGKIPMGAVSVETALEEADTKYVVFQSPGHCIYSKKFFEHAIQELGESLVLGHILLDHDHLPFLHHQCFMVNKETWIKYGKPVFGYPKATPQPFPYFASSQEHFHDNYTPHYLWVYNTGEPWPSICRPRNQGWNFLATQMKHERNVRAFSEECRKYKFNFYSDSHEKLAESLKRYESIRASFENTLYFFETDDISKVGATNEIDTLVTVASGLRILRYHKKFPNLRKVIVYDISETAIRWQDFVLQTWEGVTYPKFVETSKNNSSTFKNAIEIPPAHMTSYEYLWNSIIKEIGIDEYGDVFHRFQNCQRFYVKTDVLQQRQSILDKLAKEDTVYFDLSNVMTMPLNFVNRSYMEMYETLEDIRKELNERTDGRFMLGGLTPGWRSL